MIRFANRHELWRQGAMCLLRALLNRRPKRAARCAAAQAGRSSTGGLCAVIAVLDHRPLR